MKRIILLALLVLSAPCWSAPTLVQTATPVASTTTAQTITLNSVGAGHLLVIIANPVSNQVPTSITDSSGDTVTTDASSSSAGQTEGLALAHVANTSAGTHTITINTASSGPVKAFLAEYSGVVTASPVDGTPVVAFVGSSNPYVTSSVTPTVSGDLAIAAFVDGSTGDTFSAWTNGFTQQQLQNTTANTDVWASVVWGSTSALTASATPSTARSHGGGLVLFKASATATCTHAGWTSGGASTVPTAGSTSVWLKTGAFGTVDCSSTNYWQPTLGNFGTN